MSDTTVSVAFGGGVREVGGYRPPPFTAVQWQELEHQAMIYKYLVAGIPVPPDLVMPIRRSFEALSTRFFNHPSFGYCSYYGKKFDPEPGRCRRTDGKKWRCSKDAYQDSKYCERHMHRGRSRSRKPVESQSTSQSLSTIMSNNSTGNKNITGNVSTTGSRSLQNMPALSVGSSEILSFGSDVSKLQMEPASFAIENSKEFRYMHGLTPGAEGHKFSLDTSGGARGGVMSSNSDSSWNLLPFQISSSSFEKAKNANLLGENSSQMLMSQAFHTSIDSTVPNKLHQHCFFGSDIGSAGTEKQEQSSMLPLLMRAYE
ncbi:hypothetical protein Leryth_010866 [Lithospermum erythrorhizon]|nr:hypothetical protein Leryth_010866 [Lithospermum erythrorhizon]